MDQHFLCLASQNCCLSQWSLCGFDKSIDGELKLLTASPSEHAVWQKNEAVKILPMNFSVIPKPIPDVTCVSPTIWTRHMAGTDFLDEIQNMCSEPFSIHVMSENDTELYSKWPLWRIIDWDNISGKAFGSKLAPGQKLFGKSHRQKLNWTFIHNSVIDTFLQDSVRKH